MGSCCSDTSTNNKYDIYNKSEKQYFPHLSDEVILERIPVNFKKICGIETNTPLPLPQKNAFQNNQSLYDDYKMKKVLLVYNPFSGNGRANKNYEQCVQIFKNNKIEVVKVIETPGPNLITDIICKEDFVNKVDCIVCMGGDGTIKQIIEGIVKRSRKQKLERTPPVAFLPGGTGNSLCGSMYTLEDRYNYEKIIAQIAKGKPRKADLMEVSYYDSDKKCRDTQIAVSLVAWGIGVTSAPNAERWRFLGPARYDASIVYQLLKDGNTDVDITVENNKKISTTSNTIVALNCQYAGDGLRLSPFAKLDNGLFDICIANDTSRCKTLKMFDQIKNSGSHIYDPQMLLGQAKQVKIETKEPTNIMIDGEYATNLQTPVEIKVLESYLSVVF